jgi:hypothetical protein
MLWLFIGGIIFACFPMFLESITSLKNGVSIFNEASGGGLYLLFLVITVPIGLLLSIIGAFVST